MRRILLTCFGNAAARAFARDFATRGDITPFFVDTNPAARLALATDAFAQVPPGSDPSFADRLFDIATAQRIEMIVPGGDEDAFALMRARARFRAADITLAVQDDALLPILASKSACYAALTARGFPVPPHRVVRTPEQLHAALTELGYPNRPVLMKPDAARGGAGVCVIADSPQACAEAIPVYNSTFAAQLLNGATAYLCMPYHVGPIYDVDVLTYANGDRFFGARRRFTNVTKLFSGNVFSSNPALLDFARQCVTVLPTTFLLDLDILMTATGERILLEVNPRPSGSTVSYLPFGTNLYYTLAKSYLDGMHVPVTCPPDGTEAVAFYDMVAREPQRSPAYAIPRTHR